MSLSSFIAKLGTNPTWIVANAHVWFACTLILMGANFWIVTLAAAVKEFFFDHYYEKDPPQTTMDNVTDFIGYCTGVVIGLFYLSLHG